MPFEKGKSGNANGRPKGSRPAPAPAPVNQIHLPAEAVPYVSRHELKVAIRDAVASKIDDLMPRGMKSPLEILMEACNDDKLEWGQRLTAANAAAPYIHRRQPQAVEIAAVGPPVLIAFGVPPGAPELLGLLPAADMGAIQKVMAEPEGPEEQTP